MNIFTLLIDILLTIPLALIMIKIENNKNSFIHSCFVPTIFIIIVAALIPSLKKYIFLIPIFEIFIRNFYLTNINEEINNKENNEKNLNIEESQKIENSQNDSISINSNSSNSSAKKSNKSTSKKIRGFNFRNKINMKKYKGNKSERSSSPSISNND